MGKADRTARLHYSGGDKDRHRRLQVGTLQARQSGRIADLRAIAKRTQRAG